MKIKKQSIAKIESSFVSQNEDAIYASETLFALSDGAGGIGVEAHRWAHYLLEKLPQTPLKSFNALVAWQEEIWQTYFENIENKLRNSQSIGLDKFYTEGSLATLVAVWFEKKGKKKQVQIVSYGDSVVFLWRTKTKEFWTNMLQLNTFLHNPFLLNCKDLPEEHGFYATWHAQKSDVLVLTSDTIGQYLLGSFYLLEQKEQHESDFDIIRKSPSRFSAQFEILEN